MKILFDTNLWISFMIGKPLDTYRDDGDEVIDEGDIF